ARRAAEQPAEPMHPTVIVESDDLGDDVVARADALADGEVGADRGFWPRRRVVEFPLRDRCFDRLNDRGTDDLGLSLQCGRVHRVADNPQNSGRLLDLVAVVVPREGEKKVALEQRPLDDAVAPASDPPARAVKPDPADQRLSGREPGLVAVVQLGYGAFGQALAIGLRHDRDPSRLLIPRRYRSPVHARPPRICILARCLPLILCYIIA